MTPEQHQAVRIAVARLPKGPVRRMIEDLLGEVAGLRGEIARLRAPSVDGLKLTLKRDLREVLVGMANGERPEDTGRRLHRSVDAIRSRRARAYAALGVEGKGAAPRAVALAMAARIILPGDLRLPGGDRP